MHKDTLQNVTTSHKAIDGQSTVYLRLREKQKKSACSLPHSQNQAGHSQELGIMYFPGDTVLENIHNR